jgi:hypothetical protein
MHLRQTSNYRQPQNLVRNLNYVEPWTQFRALEPPSPVSSPSQWDLWDFRKGPPADRMELESTSPTARALVGEWAHDTAEFLQELGFNQFDTPAIYPTGSTAEPQVIPCYPNKPRLNGYPTPESSLSKTLSSSGAVTTTRYDMSLGDCHSDSGVTFLVGSQFEAASAVNGPPYSQPGLGSVPPNDRETVVGRNTAEEAPPVYPVGYGKRVQTPQRAACSWPGDVSCEVPCECHGPLACVSDGRHNYDTLSEHRTGGSILSGFNSKLQSEAVVTQPKLIPLPEAQLAGSVDRHLRLALRQERREAKPARRLTTGTLERKPLLIIQEDGHGGVTRSGGAFKKGVRKGHLLKEKAEAAAEKRKKQNVCIRCRLQRVEVGILHPT